MKYDRTYLALQSVLALTLGLFPTAKSRAQIVPDASLPVNSIVAPDGNLFTIDGGTPAGSNLFHSFQDFSLPTGSEAFFNNGLSIDNIITRVTGGNISNIDGLIRANGGANLFLLNPNGIVFGPNARLDIGGSFLGSTADSVLFEDGSFYSATEANASPLLSVNVPIGLQMGASPGPITVRGPGHQIELDLDTFDFIKDNRPVGLQVPTGQTLALVGGDILLDGGNLTASDGRIETWSVRNTEVSLDTSSSLELSHLGSAGADWGTLTLQQSASMDASGNRGGAIQIRGRGLTLQDASFVFSDTLSDTKGEGISVQTTEFVELLGVSAPGQLLLPGITTFALGSQSISGDIRITTERLQIANGDTIASNSFGSGSSAGDIIIQAADVEMRGSVPFGPFFTSSFIANFAIDSQGNGGDIIINADRVRLLDGARVVAGLLIGSGNAGDVIVRASEGVEVRGTRIDGTTTLLATEVQPQGRGQGGTLVIETPRLVVAEGGQISTAVAGSGEAGNIEIRATEVLVSDPVRDRFGGTISGITAEVREGATGRGGSINIEAARLRVFDGGQITSANEGEGNAGSITVQVRELDVLGSGVLRATEGVTQTPLPENGRFTPSAITASSNSEGAAGSVNIDAETLRASDSAQIRVSNTGSGDAGNLNATVHNIILDNGANLQGEVNGGSQGNINLNVGDTFILRRGSSIVANATGDATGGNINIDTETLVALENSDISANADRSFGGQVNISAEGIFGTQFRDAPTPESDITATSALGAEFSGVVEIKTPDVDTSLGLVNFSQEVVDPGEQVVTGCRWTADSEFVASGRGGIPGNPHRPMSSSRTWSDVRDLSEFRGETVESASVRVETPQRLVEATGWVVNEAGTVELVATANPSQLGNFAASGCNPRRSGEFPSTHGETAVEIVR